MKIIARLFTIIFVLAIHSVLFANVVVKGHVTYSNGQPANGYAVVIKSDSSDMACLITHFKTTNPNGIYQDTLVCNGTLKHIIVWVRDCQNNIIYKSLDVPSSNIVEANFIVCSNVQCHTDFTWSNHGNTQIFNIINTQAGNNTATIINYNWNFGDGTIINTTSPTSPSHTFQLSGYYNVCLTIKTSDSCKSSACHAVGILTNCVPKFTWAAVPNVVNQIKFNSSGSVADSLMTDSIISRKWIFGDGDSLVGNIIDPSHRYDKPGNYTVCLDIKTMYGCEHSICIPVHLGAYLNACHANFSFYEIFPQPSMAGFAIRFQNAQSSAAIGDSIVKNNWTFGDGSSTSTNDPNLEHNYQKSGTYTVCLKIVSSGGCTDSVCKTVVILPLHCKAAFNWSLVPIADTNRLKNNIRFQSNLSNAADGHDSIITRKWVFGDGTVLNGNMIDPLHVYANTGNYKVCLFIQTATGCSDSICTNVSVIINSPQCSPTFNYTDTGLNKHFFSQNSIVAIGDSIIARTWTFGDGQTLSGNIVSPFHKYASSGTYNVCLRIITRSGCEKQWCTSVYVSVDSVVQHDLIKLVNLYPNPAISQFNAMVWSFYNNVAASLTIYDVYGVLKWTKQTILLQGNNMVTVPISQLVTGPYVFKLTTIYGVASKKFFKL